MLLVRVVHEVEGLSFRAASSQSPGFAFVKDDTDELAPLVNGDASKPVST
jgi:hypothetical protein